MARRVGWCSPPEWFVRPGERADEGKYLGPTCRAALYMTSLNDRQTIDSARM
jgi:hypothetical protein